jgi:hypothetical protein
MSLRFLAAAMLGTASACVLCVAAFGQAPEISLQTSPGPTQPIVLSISPRTMGWVLLQRSQDLASWRAVVNLLTTNNTVSYVEYPAPNTGAALYRVRSPGVSVAGALSAWAAAKPSQYQYQFQNTKWDQGGVLLAGTVAISNGVKTVTNVTTNGVPTAAFVPADFLTPEEVFNQVAAAEAGGAQLAQVYYDEHLGFVSSAMIIPSGGLPRLDYKMSLNFYASTSGSSANSGLSTDAPWPLSYALANAGVGNTIVVFPGSYPSITLDDPFKHTALSLKALVKWTAMITNNSGGDGIYISSGVNNVVIDSLQIGYNGDRGIACVGGYATFRNCWIHHNYSQGILCPYQPSTIVDSCLIEWNGWGQPSPPTSPQHGIYLNGTNCIVRNNVIRYHESWGAQIYGSDSAPLNVSMECKIYNNLFYGNGAGLTVWAYGPYTNYVFGNTICNNTKYGFVANYGTIMVTNNIVLGNPSGNLVQGADGSSTWYYDYNLSTASLSPYNGPHDVASSAANFANIGNGLYWLVSGSPARGKALAGVYGPPDFFGNTESSVSDIGAFQYNATLTGDTRVLDPSPANPDYWSLP